MGTDRGFRSDGTLSVEFITLDDGTQMTKNYDKTGTNTIEEKYYREDGTLKMRKEYDPQGRWVTIQYDKTGKKPIKQPRPNDKIRELVESAELLSKKGSKHRGLSIQKQIGE